MEKPPTFTENRFLKGVVADYALVWIATALNSEDKGRCPQVKRVL